MVEYLQSDKGIRLLLRPNRSITWPGLVRVWAALTAFSALIATGMFLIGAWVVVPFTGLELAALGAGLYYTARKCARKEVLVIAGDDLCLEKGLYRREAQWTLPRRHTRVHVVPASHSLLPPKFYLRHRDVDVSLGQFLNRADSQKLLAILESQGLAVETRRQVYEGFWF